MRLFCTPIEPVCRVVFTVRTNGDSLTIPVQGNGGAAGLRSVFYTRRSHCVCDGLLRSTLLWAISIGECPVCSVEIPCLAGQTTQYAASALATVDEFAGTVKIEF